MGDCGRKQRERARAAENSGEQQGGSWENAWDWKQKAGGDRYPNGERRPDGEPEGGYAQRGGMIVSTPGGCGKQNSGVLVAILMIGAGVLFFLSNLGLVRIHEVLGYWPLILVAVGLTKLAKNHRGFPESLPGILFVVIGAFFLLLHLHLISFGARVMVPLALVGVGVLMLTRALGHRDGTGVMGEDGLEINDQDADAVLQEWAVFGGVKRVVDTPDFLGGTLMAAFGGIEIDLRRAQMVPRDRPVTLDANAAFGGIHIRVPDTWRVAVRGVGVFGGYEDKTLRAGRADRTAPLLVITGFAAFGGVTVE